MGRLGVGGKAVDYRRLAGDLSDLSLSADALGTDFRSLHSELLSFGGYRTSGGGVRRLPATQLTAEWLQQNGGFRPVLVPASPTAAKELGMKLPEGHVTVDRLASKIGLPFEVHTMDVQTQCEGPRWTLHQWCLYWDARRAASREPALLPATTGAASLQQATLQQQQRAAPAEDEADSAAVRRKRSAEEEAAAQQLKGISAESRKRLLEVGALPLAGTPVEGEVSPPAAVSAVDLAQQVWPAGAPSRPAAAVNLVMSPEGAYTDFHLAAGGSSVWLHCLSGRRALALVPPTPRNLATYVAWAASARYAGVFLATHCEGVLRLELNPGDTLIIPGGWAHASATTSSALMLGGTFLRRDALTLQLEAWRIEDHLAVRPRYRYPAFKQVLWYAAAAFARRLQRLAGLSGTELRERVAAQLAAMAAEEEQAAAAKAAGGSEGPGDSDSVSKAGAAKKKKGWAAEHRELADDAGTRQQQQRQQAGKAAALAAAVGGIGGSAAPKSLQPQAAAAAAAQPPARPASAPRQVGRAVGGGGVGGASRLRRVSGSGGKVAVTGGMSKPTSRLHPTQMRVDVRGGGGGGGGGGFRRQKRQRSPDSFIEQDSADEGGGGGSSGEDAEEVEWAPHRAGGGGSSRGGAGPISGRTGRGGFSVGAGSDVDVDVDDMELSEGEEELDREERAAAAAAAAEVAAFASRRPYVPAGIAEGQDEGGDAAPRRMTARQAARAAAAAVAWDGRLASRQAGGGCYGEELDDAGVGDEYGAGGSRRGRQSTRHKGQLPARLAAMLQEEEEGEEELEQHTAAAAAAGFGGAVQGGAAAAALAAFAAAEQAQGWGTGGGGGYAAAQQQQQQQAIPVAAGLKPVKIKVKAPAAPAGLTAAAAAGMPPQVEQQVQQQQVQQQPSAQKLVLKLKPAGAGAGSSTPHQQQQAVLPQEPLIPQVDGAADEGEGEGQGERQGTAQEPQQAQQADPLQAMYDALYEEGEGGGQQEQEQQQQQEAAAQLPAILASPLGKASAALAGARALQPQAAGAGAGAAGSNLEQQQQLGNQQGAQPSGSRGSGKAPPPAQHAAAAAAAAAEAAAASEGLRQAASERQRADSSQAQLEVESAGQDSVAAHASGASLSPSVEGPAASGGQVAAAPAEAPAAAAAAADPAGSGGGGAAAAAAGGGLAAASAGGSQGASQQAAGSRRPDEDEGADESGGEVQPAAQLQAKPGAEAEAPVPSSDAVPPPQEALKPAAQPAAAAAVATAAKQEEQVAVGGGGFELEDAELDGSAAAVPAEPLSLEEEEGLAALLAALKQWLRAPHALNDVPLSISDPKAVVARLEVCMRALGLSLTPPPAVDFDSVPLERLLPVRTPRAGGTAGMLAASHQTPQTGGGSEFVPGDLDAVGEDGGEFDPDDLLEEGGQGVVVEESAGPKRKLSAVAAAKPSTAVRAGGSAGRQAQAPPAAKRGKPMSVKDRLKKKLQLK